ncbi:uncharacterized protein LOC126590621 [Malus sylvestris]|uniref:uncharacterized protein LOC126590621 n=1 Tax=Malus sylvestris TaxID=3752 RepID=UPI0021AC0047|nr:uncharacterized protein LOC126590621 [Malus sylvestris]
MARERGTSAQPWGTLEELLLVCAVNRHGAQSWDSVALEVGSRCSPTATTRLSADNCRDKFADIKRRFVSEDDDDDSSSGSLGAMVDELRRLRVEELRREVRRRDVSIVSLELKVKRLVEERERSLKEDAGANRPSKDLKRRGEDQRDGSPENLAEKMYSGEDFGSDFNSDERENRSFNESNSTSQRGDAKGNGAAEKLAEGEQEEEPRTDGNEPDPIRVKIRSEPDRDCSVNGKVADDDDEDNQNNNKKGVDDTAKASRLGESSELWESGGESKREGKRGGGGAAASRQQNSDVQSSASLSKRKRRRGRGGEGGGGSRSRSRSSSGEEAEGDEVSPATSKGVKQLKLVKSEPLMKVLKIIRSHRLGSVFERRLRSQESERYKSLIRQHMDLHVIQSKLNKGLYTEDCILMFFRDLLLLFNNAVVFFRKNSPEHNAAQELRSIVLKEMNDQLPNPQPATGTVTSNVPKIETKAPKIEPDVFDKPTKSSIVVCGKRGSVNALSEGGEKAKVANEKKTDGAASVKVEDKGIRRRRTQERGGRRGTSTRGRSAAKPTKPHEYGVNELSSHDGLEALEAEKEKKENRRKKQGAARFLKRMKQNSPSTEVKKEASDGSEDDSDESEDEKKKKKKKPTTRGRKKPEVERNERVTRSSTGSGGGRGGGRRCQESNGRGRRGVGRPPKRPETAAAEAGSRKRGRENGEADQVGSAGRRRKRTRR